MRRSGLLPGDAACIQLPPTRHVGARGRVQQGHPEPHEAQRVQRAVEAEHGGQRHEARAEEAPEVGECGGNEHPRPEPTSGQRPAPPRGRHEQRAGAPPRRSRRSVPAAWRRFFTTRAGLWHRRNQALLHDSWVGENSPTGQRSVKRSRGKGRRGGLRDPGCQRRHEDSRQGQRQSSAYRFDHGLRHRPAVQQRLVDERALPRRLPTRYPAAAG